MSQRRCQVRCVLYTRLWVSIGAPKIKKVVQSSKSPYNIITQPKTISKYVYIVLYHIVISCDITVLYIYDIISYSTMSCYHIILSYYIIILYDIISHYIYTYIYIFIFILYANPSLVCVEIQVAVANPLSLSRWCQSFCTTWVQKNARGKLAPPKMNQFVYDIWMFPKIGIPQNGWFIMENTIFWKHPYVYITFPTGKRWVLCSCFFARFSLL